MIERLLPPEAACAEAFGDPPDAVLYPEEEALVSRATEKRRREFRTVRHCARQAMAQLGLPPASVLPGERREPRWPAGVVGSLTHCAGYRAAVLAHRRHLLTVGIDAEPHQPLPPDVLGAISDPGERRALAELAREVDCCWDRLLFCAKEAVYKAWFPVTRRWLGFQDATVSLRYAPEDPATGEFTARILVPDTGTGGPAPRGFAGRWLICDGLMVAAIAVAV